MLKKWKYNKQNLTPTCDPLSASQYKHLCLVVSRTRCFQWSGRKSKLNSIFKNYDIIGETVSGFKIIWLISERALWTWLKWDYFRLMPRKLNESMTKFKSPFITICSELKLRYPKNNNIQNVLIKQHNNDEVKVDLECFFTSKTKNVYWCIPLYATQWVETKIYRREIKTWLSGFLPYNHIHQRFSLNSDLTVYLYYD